VSDLTTFLKDHPDTRYVEVLMPDMNGILRCKRVPRNELTTFFDEGLTACGSISICNSRGDLPESLDLGTRDGDPDVRIVPITDSLAPVPWLSSPTAQVLASFRNLDGSNSELDCRHALERAASKLKEQGISMKLAIELELYLLDPIDAGEPQRHLGTAPGTNLTPGGVQYASVDDLWLHDGFLDSIRQFADIQAVPASTMHSEFCAGQYEINLHHVDDPLIACDHAVLLKRLIRGAARTHDLGVSFMAKPFGEAQGCGMHVHMSLYDDAGNNVFADQRSSATPPISPALEHAIAGLQTLMSESMAIFAPKANSSRRLQPGTFVPLTPNWGYNHRGVALRIPVSSPANLRFEHRVAGADANPYLVVAAILAAAHHGMESQLVPDTMIQAGTILDDDLITLPIHWDAALDAFDKSTVLPRYLGERFCEIFAAARRDESAAFHGEVSNRDYEWYLGSV
jgi:glutamine synthetase